MRKWKIQESGTVFFYSRNGRFIRMFRTESPCPPWDNLYPKQMFMVQIVQFEVNYTKYRISTKFRIRYGGRIKSVGKLGYPLLFRKRYRVFQKRFLIPDAAGRRLQWRFTQLFVGKNSLGCVIKHEKSDKMAAIWEKQRKSADLSPCFPHRFSTSCGKERYPQRFSTPCRKVVWKSV